MAKSSPTFMKLKREENYLYKPQECEEAIKRRKKSNKAIMKQELKDNKIMRGTK